MTYSTNNIYKHSTRAMYKMSEFLKISSSIRIHHKTYREITQILYTSNILSLYSGLNMRRVSILLYTAMVGIAMGKTMAEYLLVEVDDMDARGKHHYFI